MNNDKKLRRRILFHALLPSVIASIVVLGGFAYLQSQQINASENGKLALAQHLAAAHSGNLAKPEAFERLAQTLLAIEPLRRVSLYRGDGQLLATEGLPNPGAALMTDLPFAAHANHWQDGNVHYALLPLRASPESQAPAPQPLWILLEMDLHPFNLLRHQAFTTLLLVILAALAACAFCSYRLRTSIVVPLQHLKNGLNDYLAGNTEQPILVGEESGFQDIADAVGELAKKQRLEQDDMQSYLEEYTQELRETLETVEIQNIELDIARKNALESSRAKSEFLANASHELRTPLNGILGFSSLLLKTDLSDQQTDYLSTIEHSAQGLLTIINDILDISRLETGDLILEYKPVPIYPTIEEVLKMHAPSAHEKKLRLITLIDSHVPENLLGDPQRLKQVVANLISNAIKFSDKGTVIIRVNFMGETDNQIHLKFSVSDNGSGLTREQQEGLFETFSQTDTADNRMHGGTGLGLAIAKGLVQRMHGEIGVESEVGRGSTFWFTARLGINNRQPPANRYNNSLAGQHALVYDHNSSSRSEITHLLGNWGASYTELDDFNRIPELAAQIVQRFSSSIAILDAHINDNLFDKEQLRACIETLNSEYHLPVIVLALPNICRMLEPTLEKLQAVAVPRPVPHHHLHRVICSQLGVSAGPTEAGHFPVKAGRLDEQVTVLAVDDNIANLRLVSELLKGQGVKVDTAASGEEALAHFADGHYDLILMDIQMPGMDGLETTRRLRLQEKPGQRIPIVALTAHAVNEQKTRLLLAGMDDYLSKPVGDLELRHIIDRWVNNTDQPTLGTATEIQQPVEVPFDQSLFSLSDALDRAQQKPKLAKEMMAMLLASLHDSRAAITAARDNQDIPALQEHTHKLNGGCCYCGVPNLRRAADELDQLLQRDDATEIHDVSAAIDQLLQQIDALQVWAEQQDLEVLFGTD